jgi:nucleoside-diphosphate-sugar epimerase
VLEACRKLRITNVVLASSETLTGVPFNPHDPGILPITEEHELRPESAYSLSKLMGEHMAEQFARWDPTTKIVTLRFSYVTAPEYHEAFENWQHDPMVRRSNCWGYIDARDGGQAISKSLASQMKGHRYYLIAAGNTCMRMDNGDLCEAAFPSAKYVPTAGSSDSLLSIEKAKNESGFEPLYNWEDNV